MIIDTLDHLEKYFSLNPLFRDVIDFIHSNDVERMPLGKHLIKGDDLFVNIAKFKGKAKAEAVLESHRRMIDIAICFNADETFGPRLLFPRQNIIPRTISLSIPVFPLKLICQHAPACSRSFSRMKDTRLAFRKKANFIKQSLKLKHNHGNKAETYWTGNE